MRYCDIANKFIQTLKEALLESIEERKKVGNYVSMQNMKIKDCAGCNENTKLAELRI